MDQRSITPRGFYLEEEMARLKSFYRANRFAARAIIIERNPYFGSISLEGLILWNHGFSMETSPQTLLLRP
jgi:hypothetical protein